MVQVCLLGRLSRSLTAVRPHESSGIPEGFESASSLQWSCFQSVEFGIEDA